MKVYTKHQSFNKFDFPTVLIIGNFDGLHLGHQKIITQAKNIALEKQLKFTVLSFEPHPIKFFKPQVNFKRVNNLRYKLLKFKEFGCDYLYLQKFNQHFANISPKQFIEEILIKSLKVSHLVIGYNFVFAKNRQGNIEHLKYYAEQGFFDLTIIEKQASENNDFSSSLLRENLSIANFNKVTEILGHNYTLTGRVRSQIKSTQNLAHSIVYINEVADLALKHGNYIVKLPQLNKLGLANFNIMSISDMTSTKLLEVHIPNENIDLYNKYLTIEFLKFIPEQPKFENMDIIKTQIQLDLVELINYE